VWQSTFDGFDEARCEEGREVVIDEALAADIP